MQTSVIDRTTAAFAMAAGVVAIAADVAFSVFSAVGEPWGSINDVGNGAFAVLAGWVAWSFRGRTGIPAAATALAGAAIAVGGSWLVLSGSSGWLLAGFVSSVGFGLIGPSMYLAARSLAAEGVISRGLGRLGLAAGAITIVGLTGIVPAVMRLDNDATAPGWVWVAFVGWVGTFVVYPVWSIVIGRRALQVPVQSPAASRA